jgi:hypothetical protein
MALALAPDIMANTFAQLRTCGQGRDECVVYWTGLRNVPGAVDGIIHPAHRAGPDWYEIESAWITSFFLELRRTGRTARAQVHTHPTHLPDADGLEGGVGGDPDRGDLVRGVAAT